jgi:hypothetical protein
MVSAILCRLCSARLRDFVASLGQNGSLVGFFFSALASISALARPSESERFPVGNIWL